MRLPLGSVAALTAQLVRYVLGQVATVRTRTGKAQLSGHTLDEVVFGTLLVCGCADGDVPSAANLNLYEGSRSHVSWHCDGVSVWSCR